MRGRKSDSEFISDFITDCIRKGRDTPEAIVQSAREEISTIDEEIKRVEALRVDRAKYMDVIASFEKSSKPSKVEEAKLLSFFKIQQPQVCKYICERLKNNVVTVEDVAKSKYSPTDVMFCIKQLLEHRIISKSGVHLLRGEKFEDYLKFVLKGT